MKNKIWASAHTALEGQMEGDFVALKDMEGGASLQARLNSCPSEGKLLGQLALELYRWAHAHQADLYQPGGSPALQFRLGAIWAQAGEMGVDEAEIPQVYYSVSERASIDTLQPDGTVKKVSVFRHQGWCKATC